MILQEGAPNLEPTNPENEASLESGVETTNERYQFNENPSLDDMIFTDELNITYRGQSFKTEASAFGFVNNSSGIQGMNLENPSKMNGENQDKLALALETLYFARENGYAGVEQGIDNGLCVLKDHDSNKFLLNTAGEVVSSFENLEKQTGKGDWESISIINGVGIAYNEDRTGRVINPETKEAIDIDFLQCEGVINNRAIVSYKEGVGIIDTTTEEDILPEGLSKYESKGYYIKNSDIWVFEAPDGDEEKTVLFDVSLGEVIATYDSIGGFDPNKKAAQAWDGDNRVFLDEKGGVINN
jgi:hypothetical protein